MLVNQGIVPQNVHIPMDMAMNLIPQFENIKRGGLQSQFKAYQKQFPKSMIKTVEHFAQDIQTNPHHYQAATVKRAGAFHKKLGGKLAAQEVKQLVQSSYDKNNHNLDEFDIDHELSGDKVKVYKKKGSNQVAVVHRGTQGLGDIAIDAAYVLGKDISKTDRYKHALDIQKKAESKYGKENISTVGHSLGAKIASMVGDDSHEIINVNKAVAPQDLFKKISEKETNIRTKYDPVSALLSLKGNANTFTIPSTTIDPLAEHSTDTLDRVDANQMFGRGGGRGRGRGRGGRGRGKTKKTDSN